MTADHTTAGKLADLHAKLELAKERRKYENDENMAAADKRAKLAEIDGKLAELAKQAKR